LHPKQFSGKAAQPTTQRGAITGTGARAPASKYRVESTMHCSPHVGDGVITPIFVLAGWQARQGARTLPKTDKTASACLSVFLVVGLSPKPTGRSDFAPSI